MKQGYKQYPLLCIKDSSAEDQTLFIRRILLVQKSLIHKLLLFVRWFAFIVQRGLLCDR